MVPAGRPRQAAARPAPPPGPLVELGRIVNRHGIRGELRMLPYNPESPAVRVSSPVVLTRPDGSSESRRVVSRRRHKQFLLLGLEGVATANDAEALVGCRVSVARADLPASGPAAIYHVDLVGCAVRTTAGEALGVVDEIIVTGSNDVCVVRGARGEVLIPLIADVIAELDTAARTVVVHPVPGLLDS
jgi:16S rRNA processing protein RimM